MGQDHHLGLCRKCRLCPARHCGAALGRAAATSSGINVSNTSLTGFALNYANIIALPVLLGVGVAFKIYYVLAWRKGETDFLQSALTRAVFFSAVLTATAFGSLWLSAHPGTSSMGKLLALSLACTLTSAVLF